MSIALGLPSGLLPTPEIAMSSQSTSQLVRVQPNNVSSVQSAAFSLPLTADSLVNNIPFPAQLLQFSIPAGGGRNVWLDVDKTTVSFRVNYAVTQAGTSQSGGEGYLQAGASSWINRIVHIGPNGSTLDDCVNVNVAEHVSQLLNLNSPDRDCFAAGYGFSSEAGSTSAVNKVQGHAIPKYAGTGLTSAASEYYSYEIPLASALIGKNARSMFPIGAIGKLDVQLYTPSVAPVTIYTGTVLGTSTAPAVQITIDNIAINAWYITLDTESARLLGAPKVHSIHGITSRVATANIPAGSGYINTLIGLRGKSCRQLFTRFVDQGTPAAGTGTSVCNQACNSIYDSKMLICSQLNYLLNGQLRVPSYPHATNLLPASVFSRTLMASEMYDLWKQHSSFVPNQYFKFAVGQTATIAANVDARVIAAASASTPSDLCTFVFGEDLRKAHSSQALDGADLTLTASQFLEMNVTSAPTNAQTAWFIGFFDIIFEVDMQTGDVTYRM